MGAAPETGQEEAAPDVRGFSIERILGHGGMGTVYLARDLVLDRPVALKILPADLTADQSARWRFEREARALARVMHPNVVPIHAFGEQDDRHYMVMGFVEGEPLDAVLKAARAREESRFARYFRRDAGREVVADLASAVVARAVAEALGELHEAGIVHRDVKPANIVIHSKGRPILVDFGIACDPSSQRLGCDAISTGTLRFMPPEHLSGGAAQVDPRADVYSLGIVLFEMLALAPAFAEIEMDSLVDAIVAGAPRRPRAVAPSVSRSLDAVVRRATMRDPGERFQSAREMAQALDSVVHELTGAARSIDARVLGLQLESVVAQDRGHGLLPRLAAGLAGALGRSLGSTRPPR